MIDVYYEIARLQLREIAKETRSTNLPAGTLHRWCYVEEISISEQRHARVRKSHAFGKRSANQQQRGRLRRGFRSEPRCGVLRFTEHVGNFVFTRNVARRSNSPKLAAVRNTVPHAG